MFPFLIGTVRTVNKSVKVRTNINLFPFLIGTVRTYASSTLIELVLPFPFLIGTVRTKKIGSSYDAYKASFHSS
mgnify:CR=1 FL=1